MEEKKYAIPTREYSIDKTTQREKLVNEALGLSMVSGPLPSEEFMLLAQKYIDGEMEIHEIQACAIALYDRRDML